MSVLLPCPRCHASMQEIPCGLRWLGHWICRMCDSAWHFEGRQLVQGRELRGEIVPTRRHRRPRGLPRNAAVSHKPFQLEAP